MKVRAILRRLARHPGRSALLGLAAAVAVWIAASNLPAIGGARLPADLEESLRQHYTTCVTDTPIWPGEPRQPECGQVRIDILGEGTLPPDAQSQGIERALCYQITITTPSWTTQGTTRHEIVVHGRTVSKVAVVQDGAWTTFPDQDEQDALRWSRFACPGPFHDEAIDS